MFLSVTLTNKYSTCWFRTYQGTSVQFSEDHLAGTYFISLYPITLQYLTFSDLKKKEEKKALLEVNRIYTAELRAEIF